MKNNNKKANSSEKELPVSDIANTDMPVAEAQEDKKETAPVIASQELNEHNFPVIGMGGSAGALGAFENFFVNSPLDTGMAYILVQHMVPKNPSILTDLIKRNTKMPVFWIHDGLTLQPNCVFIAPPGKLLVVEKNTLLLKDSSNAADSLYPINVFLSSLAVAKGPKAIAILFSGMGTDGTKGMGTIKEAGGITLVQDPASATYDSMPVNAIDADVVDYVLPVEEMPEVITSYYKETVNISKDLSFAGVADKYLSAMHRIFSQIKAQTGHDFSLYKQNIISRRIERRMVSLQIKSIAEYLQLLKESPDEVQLLFKELLIGVTSFFRDPETFAILRETYVPQLIKKKVNDTIRIWTTGCSTGEEAYSLAILIHECLEEANLTNSIKVQLFATDIDPDAIEKARHGIYPASIGDYVSPERLERFFHKKGSSYQVRKEIRDYIVFAVQSVIKDPPFTKLDLLTCRNLLIYLGPELQKKLISLFHYALNPGGMLLLGSSETIGSFNELFTPLDAKQRIFLRKETSTSFSGMVSFPMQQVFEREANRNEPVPVKRSETEVSGEVQRVLLDNYAPPSVVVNSKGDIHYVNGHTGKYLELAPGQAVLNVLTMAREGLRLELIGALQEVSILNKKIERKDVRIKTETGYYLVDVIIKPFSDTPTLHGLILIIFEDHPEQAMQHPIIIEKYIDSSQDTRVAELEKELLYTKRYLQNTIEEMESSLEELTLTNEEAQSTNEELQSANEELMTSKEELQSLNEELVTVNAELQAKMDEFAEINNDIKNLIDNTDIATIFLDNQLNIRRLTAKATKVVNLIQSDLGRPITDIVFQFRYDELVDDVKEVLDTLMYKERDVQTVSGQWYQVKIAPYRTVDNFIGGTVISFTDISRYKFLLNQVKDMQNLTDTIINSVRDSLIILTQDLKIVSANDVFYKTFKVLPKQTEGKYLFDIGNGQWNIAALRQRLEEISPQHKELEQFEVVHDFPLIGRKKMLLNGRSIADPGQQPKYVLLLIEDTSDKGLPQG